MIRMFKLKVITNVECKFEYFFEAVFEMTRLGLCKVINVII